MQLFSMLLLVAPAMCLHIAAPAAPRFAVAQMQRAPAVVAMVSAGPRMMEPSFFPAPHAPLR